MMEEKLVKGDPLSRSRAQCCDDVRFLWNGLGRYKDLLYGLAFRHTLEKNDWRMSLTVMCVCVCMCMSQCTM